MHNYLQEGPANSLSIYQLAKAKEARGKVDAYYAEQERMKALST